MPGCRRPSAGVAVSYKLVGDAAHGIPVVVALEDFEGLCMAWVSKR